MQIQTRKDDPQLKTHDGTTTQILHKTTKKFTNCTSFQSTTTGTLIWTFYRPINIDHSPIITRKTPSNEPLCSSFLLNIRAFLTRTRPKILVWRQNMHTKFWHVFKRKKKYDICYFCNQFFFLIVLHKFCIKTHNIYVWYIFLFILLYYNLILY